MVEINTNFNTSVIYLISVSFKIHFVRSDFIPVYLLFGSYLALTSLY